MLDSHLLSLLFLGFLLGVRHALDADHVAAILTITTENQSLWRSSLIGFCWGLGHTLILLMVGAGVLLFRVTMPSAWEKAFEAGVGVMLVALGLSVAFRLWRERVHLHTHRHDAGEEHRHFHSHRHGAQHDHLHRFRLEYKSLIVGMVHGLAGSAALLILVLATVSSLAVGILYIVIFGIGSILGMMLLATAMSVPFTISAEKMARVYQALRATAALVSIVLGSRMLLELLVT